jgi:hypothetical protein
MSPELAILRKYAAAPDAESPDSRQLSGDVSFGLAQFPQDITENAGRSDGIIF